MPEAKKIRDMDGYDVYHSAEFKALCKFLGIPWDARTVCITLTIPCDGLVTVDHQYRVPKGMIDTTDLHNTRFRTSIPPRANDAH